MNREKDSDLIGGLSKLICVIIVGICIGGGISFGLATLYYILPITLVLLIICVVFVNSKKDNHKKISLGTFFQAIIAISVILFILVGIGSCFHVEHHDVYKQRIEMGLPMY